MRRRLDSELHPLLRARQRVSRPHARGGRTAAPRRRLRAPRRAIPRLRIGRAVMTNKKADRAAAAVNQESEPGVPPRGNFSRRAYADLSAHANESLEAEVCGVLVGEVRKDAEGPSVEVRAVIRGAAAREA